MPKSKIPSPARSQGAPITPRRQTPRTPRSVGSPARSNTSGRLTSVIQNQNRNMDSFVLSPVPSRRSLLTDNTAIEEPKRRSWWKKLDEHSRDVMEILEDNKAMEMNEVIEEFDVEVLSQEKKNYTLDLPESSDSESISSIVIPQRKLFTQKDNKAQNKFGQLVGPRESMTKHGKSTVEHDKSIQIGKKNLFNQNSKARVKPTFPAELLKISPNKTAHKTKEIAPAEVKGQVRNLFGNRAGTKRKNMFADFIVSDSEDEIPEIQPKVFAFQKKPEQQPQRRISSTSRGTRDPSPTSSITTEMDLDDWKLLPSSTMMQNQLEDIMTDTPVKKARLSKLSEAKESDAGSTSTVSKTGQSNKSISSKNKSKASSSKVTSIVAEVELENILSETPSYNTRSSKLPKQKDDADNSNVTTNNTKSNKSVPSKNKSKMSSTSQITANDKSETPPDLTLPENNSNKSANRRKSKTILKELSVNEGQKQDEINEDNHEADQNELTFDAAHNTIINKTAKSDKPSNRSSKNISNLSSKSHKSSHDKSKGTNKTINELNASIIISNEMNIHENNDQEMGQNDEIEQIALAYSDDDANEHNDIVEENQNIQTNVNFNDKDNETINNTKQSISSKNKSIISPESRISSDKKSPDVLAPVSDENKINKSVKETNREQEMEQDEDIEDNIGALTYSDDEPNENNVIVEESEEIQGTNNEEMEEENQEAEHDRELEEQVDGNNVDENDATAEDSKQEESVNEDQVPDDQRQNESRKVEENEIQNGSQDDVNELEVENESHEAEANNQENEADSQEDEEEAVKNLSDENEIQLENECQVEEEDEKEFQNESEDVESEIELENESHEMDAEVEEDEEAAHNESEIELENESHEMDAEVEDDEEAAHNESEIVHDESQEVQEEDEVVQNESKDEENESHEIGTETEEVEEDEVVQNDSQNDEIEMEVENDSHEADDESREVEDTNEMEVNESHEVNDEDVDDEEQEIDENTENQNESEEVQNESDDNRDPSEEVEEDQISDTEQETPDQTHDTTGRNRMKDNTKVKSPEAILHDMTNVAESFTAQGRNTSIRKTTMLRNLNIRPSLAPPRESTGFSDGTNNSSAEGSGWDSHRVTKKTLRQTFGKDFTPRKSLRALVMEKSAKRQTAFNDMNIDTIDMPRANSTEYVDGTNYDDDVGNDEDVHEISKRTRQTTLEMYLEKIKKQNMEKRLILEEAVRNSLKAPAKDILNPFKVPAIPNFTLKRKMKPVQSKPKTKVGKSIIPLDELPEELLEDMKYKPPKRFQPSNASWITKRLYKFLESKLEAKYNYKARVRAEKLVETIYHFSKDLRRHNVAPPSLVDVLKNEMARLDVVHTHHDFYQFFHEYMPREIRVKVVPDIVNRISLPRHGVFTEILSGNTVQT